MGLESPEPVGRALRLAWIVVAATAGASYVAGADGVMREARRADVRREIARAAARHHVDGKLADAVAKVESGYEPFAVSLKGAIGVMQLMRETARGLGADPKDVRQNIDAGVRYLAYLQERYHGDLRLTLAAYNAGPGAVEWYGGIPPYPETVEYVQAVLWEYSGVRSKVRTGRRRPVRLFKGATGSLCAGVEIAHDARGWLFFRSRPMPASCLETR